MAMVCDVCEKRPLVGNAVSHANNKTKKRSMPNLQRVHVKTPGRSKHIYACTRCIKKGRVLKAA